MAGDIFTKDELNAVLLHIVRLLHKHTIERWCIGYGTLLGIIREQSCINNDDDVDILIDREYAGVLHRLIQQAGGTYVLKKPNFCKVKFPLFKPTVDFYMCCVEGDVNTTNLNDTWENTVWMDVCPFENIAWNDVILQTPKNPISKLVKRYGQNWSTPMKSKGVKPKLTKL
jgi:phosphorylcholine metabolism protein LicD